MASSAADLLSRGQVRVPMLVGGGVFLTLAYPTTDWSVLAWVALVPLVASVLVRSPRQALGDGWLLGTVFFVLLLRWLDHTFRNYSAIPWPLTWLPIVALAAYCGLYFGCVTALGSWLRGRLGVGCAMAVLPFLWVSGELIRGRILSGFPWGLLGYSQYRQLALIQVAEWTGVYGVSFVIVAVNTAVAGVALVGWRRMLPAVVAAAALVAGALGLGVTRLGEPSREAAIRVALVQPSIEQSLKWDPAFQRQALGLVTALTRQAARGRPALVVWPETAAPIFLRREPGLLADLRALASEVEAPILLGAVDGNGPAVYNSAFLLAGRGILGKYDKIHLVPFGEYVPLSGIIGFVKRWTEFISEFEAGSERRVFREFRVPFGVVICYEGIFPELFREFVAEGAGFMANITNDAWFGTTSGPWQHLAMLPFRAVENRVAIARAANTGVSAAIDPQGRIVSTLGLFQRGVREVELPLRSRTTVYTQFGDLFAYAAVALSALALALGGLRRGSPIRAQ